MKDRTMEIRGVRCGGGGSAFIVTAVTALVLVAQAAAAQPILAVPRNHVEFFLGVGSLGTTIGPPLPVLPWVHGGMAMWIGPRWGIAVRHARSRLITFTDRISDQREPIRLLDGTERHYYSTVTGRFRVFLDSGIELAVGVGAQLGGTTRTNVRHRALPAAARMGNEAEGGALDPSGEVNVSQESPWGRGLGVEMFVGRRLTRHLGGMGGVLFHGDPRNTTRYEAVLLAKVVF